MSRFRFLLLFKCAILLAGFFLFPDAKAQQSVGIGTSTPNPNAILDISSDRQGLLVPRLSSSQRLQMAQILQSSSGNEGMIVFDTDKGKFYYWFEGEWKEGLGAISSSEVAGDLNGDVASPLVVGLQGRAIANTTPATNQVLKWNGSAWTPASDVGREYSAGEGIEINDGTLINTGDLNGGDDVLITDIAGGDLGGTFSNLSIKNNAVSSSKIANEAITTAKVGDEAITTEKLADAAVTPSKIQAGSANSILAVGADGTIQWQSKSGFMDTQLEAGKILIGNASGEAEERNLSGDVSLAADGEITIEDGAINSGKILDGSVATVDIANDAITREKIAGDVAGSGLIQEADGSIAVNTGTTLNITGDALNLSNTGVTTGDYGQKDKVAQFTVDAQGRIVAATEVDIEALPAGLAGGDLSGSYPTPTIRDGAITQTKIANDAVGVAQIKDDDPNAILITDPSGNPRWFETYANHVIVTSVDGQIIQENRNNFATSSLQNGYIFIGGPDNKATSISANTTGNILIGNGSGLSSVDVSGDVDIAITGETTVQPGAINNAKLANDAVSSAKILDGSIATTDLADGSVTGAKLGANAVTTDKISDGTIVNADLAANSVNSSNIVDGTIVAVDLANDAVTTNKITDEAVTSVKILDGTISDADLNKTAIPLSGFGAAEAAVNLGTNKLVDVADPTDAQDAATKNYVDAASAADGDKDATNEIQDLSLSGNSLSLSGDDTPVDLSPYLDNTDGQQLSLDGNNLELENGGSVDLSGYLDNTDNQDLEHVLNVGNDAGGIAITNLADPTEEQDAATKNYVDAASAADGDKDSTNEIQDLSLSGNSLSLSGDDTPVDLSPYLDNTDGQQLSLDGNNLELENGGSVDLSGYLDNTDNQDLEHVLNVGNDAGGIAITNLADPTEDQDAATKNYVDEQITTSNALPEGHVYVGDADDTSTAVDASASGNILVGDGTTVNSVAVSGDMSLSSDGTATIGEGTITSAKILDGSIATTDLADGSISGAKLGANAVTSDKIADGTIVNADLAANSVNSSNIIDGTIGAGDLANDAVTTSKIVDGAVTSAKILDGTISTVDLADGIVTNAKLGANAITSDKIVDGTITSEDLAPNVINSSNIVDGSVLNSDIADGAVSSEKILDGSIINDDVANNAIHFEKLNRSGASGGQVMVWSTLLNRWTPGNATNIIGGSSGDITAVTTPAGSGLQGGRESGDMILTLTNSGNGEILIGDGTNVNPATVTGDISLSSSGVATITTNAVQEVNIENNAVSSSKIQNAAITVAKIGQNGATNGQVLKWNGSAWAASDDNVNDGDASATNELQNLSISGNAISISSGNSVNISSVAPSENQVLTYKSGNWTASNPSTTGAIVRTGNYAIDPLDFVGLGSDGTESIFYYGDGDFVSSENDGKIAAPVHLTDGVQITEIQFHFHDAQNGQDMSFSLTRKSRNSGSSEVLATVNSAGDPGNDVRTLTAINHNIVDNGLYSYRVIVDLKGESYGSAKRHRVYSVIIKYTETIN